MGISGCPQTCGSRGVSPLWGKASDFRQMEGALKLREEVGTVGLGGGHW